MGFPFTLEFIFENRGHITTFIFFFYSYRKLRMSNFQNLSSPKSEFYYVKGKRRFRTNKISKVIAALLTYRNRFSYQSMNSAICAVPKYGLKSLLSFAYLLSHIIDLNCHLLFFFLEDMWSNYVE